MSTLSTVHGKSLTLEEGGFSDFRGHLPAFFSRTVDNCRLRKVIGLCRLPQSPLPRWLAGLLHLLRLHSDSNTSSVFSFFLFPFPNPRPAAPTQSRWRCINSRPTHQSVQCETGQVWRRSGRGALQRWSVLSSTAAFWMRQATLRPPSHAEV